MDSTPISLNATDEETLLIAIAALERDIADMQCDLEELALIFTSVLDDLRRQDRRLPVVNKNAEL